MIVINSLFVFFFAFFLSFYYFRLSLDNNFRLAFVSIKYICSLSFGTAIEAAGMSVWAENMLGLALPFFDFERQRRNREICTLHCECMTDRLGAHMCFPFFPVLANSNLYNFSTGNNHSNSISIFVGACGDYSRKVGIVKITCASRDQQQSINEMYILWPGARVPECTCQQRIHAIKNELCNSNSSLLARLPHRKCDCNFVEISFDPNVARHSKIISKCLESDVCVCRSIPTE